MNTTCTNTALIKCHWSYHSQAGIWQHLCVHTGKHSTWNVYTLVFKVWMIADWNMFFFRICELTHYAYCIAGKYHGGKDHNCLNLQILIGGHFSSQRGKNTKPEYTSYTHTKCTWQFFLSVCKHTGTSSLTKGLQNIVLHVLRLNINRIKHDVILILFMLKVKTWKIVRQDNLPINYLFFLL